MMLFSRGISASMPSSASGAKASFSQALVERQVELGEGLEVVPQHRPQPGAVAARQARRQLDRLAPEIGAQLGGDAGEEGVEILDQVEHVVGIEVARAAWRRPGRAARPGACGSRAPSGRSKAAFWWSKSSRKELPRILTMSVWVSSRTRTGKSVSPSLSPRPKRVTRPVDSRLPGGLISRRKS